MTRINNIFIFLSKINFNKETLRLLEFFSFPFLLAPYALILPIYVLKSDNIDVFYKKQFKTRCILASLSAFSFALNAVIDQTYSIYLSYFFCFIFYFNFAGNLISDLESKVEVSEN